VVAKSLAGFAVGKQEEGHRIFSVQGRGRFGARSREFVQAFSDFCNTHADFAPEMTRMTQLRHGRLKTFAAQKQCSFLR
jgi:hypothetical protein